MQQVAQRAPFNLGQELSKRFQAALSKLNFPKEQICSEWFGAAKVALMNASPMSLGCTAAEMKELFSKSYHDDITMLQFAVLSNNLEKTSMADLPVSKQRYFEIQEETEELSKLWNEQTQALRKKVEQDLINEMAAKDKLDQNSKQMAQA